MSYNIFIILLKIEILKSYINKITKKNTRGRQTLKKKKKIKGIMPLHANQSFKRFLFLFFCSCCIDYYTQTITHLFFELKP